MNVLGLFLTLCLLGHSALGQIGLGGADSSSEVVEPSSSLAASEYDDASSSAVGAASTTPIAASSSSLAAAASSANAAASSANAAASSANAAASSANAAASSANAAASSANVASSAASGGASAAVTQSNSNVSTAAPADVTTTPTPLVCKSCVPDNLGGNDTCASTITGNFTTKTCDDGACWTAMVFNSSGTVYLRGCLSDAVSAYSVSANTACSAKKVSGSCSTANGLSICLRCCDDLAQCNTHVSFSTADPGSPGSGVGQLMTSTSLQVSCAFSVLFAWLKLRM